MFHCQLLSLFRCQLPHLLVFFLILRLFVSPLVHISSPNIDCLFLLFFFSLSFFLIFLILLALPEDNQIERDPKHDIANVAVKVVEIEDAHRVLERVLTSCVVEAYVVVSGLVLGLLGMERCLKDGDCIEDADEEQGAQEELVLLVPGL